MFEWKQIVARLRLGGGDREIARTQRVGRKTVANLRRIAAEHGWLEAAGAMPEETQLAEAIRSPQPRAQNVSTVESFRDEVLAWHAQGVQATTIRQALVRKHGFSGSVHAVYRFLERAAPSLPPTTVMLDFPVGETT